VSCRVVWCQLPKLPEQADGLVDLVYKMRSVQKAMQRMKIPGTEEGNIEMVGPDSGMGWGGDGAQKRGTRP
jgi:hypothetical protein